MKKQTQLIIKPVQLFKPVQSFKAVQLFKPIFKAVQLLYLSMLLLLSVVTTFVLLGSLAYGEGEVWTWSRVRSDDNEVIRTATQVRNDGTFDPGTNADSTKKKTLFDIAISTPALTEEEFLASYPESLKYSDLPLEYWEETWMLFDAATDEGAWSFVGRAWRHVFGTQAQIKAAELEKDQRDLILALRGDVGLARRLAVGFVAVAVDPITILFVSGLLFYIYSCRASVDEIS